jgi:hypothetical protein
MLRFEWNALRNGTAVAVHDDGDRAEHLDPGVVSMVQTVPGNNDVAISIERAGVHTVVRPTRYAVHLLPINPAEPCWRCERLAASS